MMKRIAFFLLMVASPANAEPVGPLVHDGGKADVATYASFGLEGAFGATIGGAMGIAPLGTRANTAAFVDATWILGNADMDDFRVRAGLRANALRYGPFRLQIAFVPEYAQTSNESFTARSLGTELRVAPGFDSGRWSGELQAAIDQQWLTYFETTSTYRTNVYASARDGWYGASATVVRVGDFLPPFYAGLSIAWTFGSVGKDSRRAYARR
jgi:hypothetical protein